MEKKTVVIYIADCGKKYQTKAGCIVHEQVCKCFTNPKFKACHTCKFNGGFEKEDGERQRVCLSPSWEYNRMKNFFIPNTRTFDCINCPLYESKRQFTGTFEKWTGYSRSKDVGAKKPLLDLPF